MLNKAQIISELNKLNFDKSQYIIISGAAMVLYGIRSETADIDIATSKNYYKYLYNNFDCEVETVINGVVIYYLDNKLVNFSTNYYDSKYEIIDGFKVQTIDSLIKLKHKLNRKKDFKDLKLIDNFLKSK